MATPPDKKGPAMMWWTARNPPKDPKTSFAGKTILITGANIGLGFESAVKFAALGASSLVLGVRSLQRGEDAKKLICKRTGFLASNIKLFHVDMSTFASVKKFADAVSKEIPQVDVALLNAGIAAPEYRASPEGYEMSIQVNAISTALLAILLLPKLRQTTAKIGKPAHLEFVGSGGHKEVTLDWLKLGPEDKIVERVSREDFFNFRTQYHISKLLLQYVAENMAANTLNASGDPYVIVTTVCPGLTRTNMGREFSLQIRVLNGIFQQFFARSCEEGSRTLVSGAALGPEGHGGFWTHDVLDKKGDLITSDEGKALGVKAWDEILEILRHFAPEVDRILKTQGS